MEKFKNLTELEEKLNVSRDLVEVAYSYCLANSEKADEISTLSSVLDLVLKTHKDLSLKLQECFYC